MKKITVLLLVILMLVPMLISCECRHEYTSRIVKAATCGAEGSREFKCSKCGDVYYESLPATGDHEWEKATCTSPKTCSVCGKTEGTAGGHKWAEATCQKPKTCSVCGKTEGSVGSHVWAAATCKAPKTCKVCGKTTGDKLEHQWVASSYNGKAQCSVCGEKAKYSLSNCIGLPLDSMSQFSAFSYYYRKDNFNSGNFRVIVNSANGAILCWAAQNYRGTIKYIDFTVEFYNTVDDPVRDEITGKTNKTIRLTGPIYEDQYFLLRTIVGYGSISWVRITDVTITYMDGSTVVGYYGQETTYNRKLGYQFRYTGIGETFVTAP